MLIATIPANILMKLLGLHRASHKRIKTRLESENYAGIYNGTVRRVIRLYKLSGDIVMYNLEQIESAWCPIAHLEKEGRVFPAYHRRFVDREKLESIYITLRDKGTVSSNLPKF